MSKIGHMALLNGGKMRKYGRISSVLVHIDTTVDSRFPDLAYNFPDITLMIGVHAEEMLVHV